jgi:hypothetical protein
MVSEIEAHAFAGYSSLKSIVIPASLEKIDGSDRIIRSFFGSGLRDIRIRNGFRL